MIIKKQDINGKLAEFKGIYFVYLIFRNDKIVYIGSSKNFYKRLKEHKYQKSFDYIELIEQATMQDALDNERKLLFEHKPEENTFCKNIKRKTSIRGFKCGIDNLISVHNTILHRQYT